MFIRIKIILGDGKGKGETCGGGGVYAARIIVVKLE